jgi:hypothetical protein
MRSRASDGPEMLDPVDDLMYFKTSRRWAP